MFEKWRKRRDCFHHDHRNGGTWLKEELIHNGMGKRWWCLNCGRQWFV